jgi:hypothetical protein
MPKTTVNVLEYGSDTEVFEVKSGIAVNESVWDACIDALQTVPFKSSQFAKGAIRRPNAWSNPAFNLGATAATTKWKSAYLAQPHVHGDIGIDHRAVIGCNLVVSPTNSKYYETMNIYLGEFS